MFIVQVLTMFTGIAGSTIDGMVIGNFLGEASMAAFGFTGCVSLVVAVISSIVSSGNSVICGKSLGEGDIDKTRHLFSASFTSALFFSGLLAALIIPLATPIAKLMGASGDLVPLAADYIRGYGIACPFIIVVSFILPVLQIDGHMKLSLIASIVMTVGDVAADFLNALVFHGGMFGMAIATGISYVAALIVLLFHFSKKDIIFRFPSIVVDFKAIWAMFSNGVPMALSLLGRMLLTFIMNIYLMSIAGEGAVAAHAVIMTAANVCLVPASAISSTVGTLTGVLFGEEDRQGLISMMKSAMMYNLVVNGIFLVLMFVFASPVVSLFLEKGATSVDLTIQGFRLYVFCIMFCGLNMAYRSFLLCAEKVIASYIITICDCFACPVIAALTLGSIFGVPQIWLCFAVGEALVSLVMLIIVRCSRKKASGIEAFIPIPADFGKNIDAVMEYNVRENNMETVEKMSQEVIDFCSNNNADKRTSFMMGLAVEEAVGNIAEHGFGDGKSHNIDLRVMKKDTNWMLRIRDDCPLFDPKKYIDQFDGEDKVANIGLKTLFGVASDVTYLNSLKLNNLIVRI